MRTKFYLVLLAMACSVLTAQQTSSPDSTSRPQDVSQYVLGPDDQVRIWALGLEEISDKPVRIDPVGYVNLPILGRIHVAGLTTDQFITALKQRLAKEVRQPQVSVDIVEFGSQPVSVMGAVNHPGVQQVSGRKTLAEMLALAGGLRPDAGPYIKITRQIECGQIPLRTAQVDSSGRFSTAQLRVKDLLSAANPTENILIQPHDVITVPTAEMVYVVGAVKKPGNFALNERESVSVLQALSMAEGLGPMPKPQDSKILRLVPGSDERREIPVDLKKVMSGKAEDLALRANDILFVPDSTAKKVTARALEAVIQTATGVIIWHGPSM
jgi:polysaccharide biosynthesis/export protein